MTAPRIPLVLLVLLILAAVVAAVAPFAPGRLGAQQRTSLGGPDADVDCDQFLSAADAEAVFEASGGARRDPYGLVDDEGRSSAGERGVPCEGADFGAGQLAGCADLRDQAEADALLLAGGADDPYGLDPDDDEVACNRGAAGDGATGDGADGNRDPDRNRNRNRDRDAAPTPTPTPAEDRRRQRNRDRDARETPTPAPAVGDRDCVEFATQEAAQAVLDADPSDPFNLDPSRDGYACSELPSTSGLVTALPKTGAGTAARGPSPDGVVPVAPPGLATSDAFGS